MTLMNDLTCDSCGRDFKGCDDDAEIYPGAPCPESAECPSHGWYGRRNELEPEMVFKDYLGDIVKLDRRVPGDGTKWYVADWSNGHWSYEDNTAEPGDLMQHLPDFTGTSA